MKKRLVCMVVAFLAMLPIFGQTWTGNVYWNLRFGFGVRVPDGWVAGSLPENNDGRSFTNPEDGAELLAYGYLADAERFPNLDSVLVRSREGNTLEVELFCQKEKDWFVRFGYTDNGKTILFEKVCYHHLYVFTVHLSIPENGKTEYEGLAEKVLKDYPLRGGWYPWD